MITWLRQNLWPLNDAIKLIKDYATLAERTGFSFAWADAWWHHDKCPHLRPHSISGLSICSLHGDVYPQISAQAWLQNVQALMLFPTCHYVIMGQCDSLVNYVTPADTAAGGTGSVTDAESAKLSLAAQFIWSFCLSLFQARKHWNTKLVALKQLSFVNI